MVTRPSVANIDLARFRIEGSVAASDARQLRRPARLSVGDRDYDVYRLDAVVDDPRRLPYSLRILLENLLRHEDGATSPPTTSRRSPTATRGRARSGSRELQFMPARVLMQDFTGVPAIVDLAAMRDAMVDARRRPARASSPRSRSISSSTTRSSPTSPACRTRSRATPSSSIRATASATRSCGGRRRRSARCASSRRTGASATRSTSSTSRRSCSATATASRTPTRSSAPTRTRRW